MGCRPTHRGGEVEMDGHETQPHARLCAGRWLAGWLAGRLAGCCQRWRRSRRVWAGWALGERELILARMA
eukprot:SAG22_NODE_143_length_17909_cov_34.254969_17_plen_70_part_00